MALLGLERGDEAATNPIYFQAEVDRLIDLARERGRGPTRWSATNSPAPTPAPRSCAISACGR